MKHRLILLFILFVFGVSAYAHNKVVIVPMSGDDLKPLKNIITVAKKNGDFTDPVAALRSTIGVATATNRYLVVIAPGVYSLTEPLNMVQFVDIAGSGKNTTKLTGSFSTSSFNGSSAVVIGNSNATLQDLSIENNNGSGTFTMGIYNNNAAPTISNIIVNTIGGNNQYGIVNDGAGSTPRISDSEVVISGGGNQTGIRNLSFSSPSISNVHVSVNGGSGSQYGIHTSASSFLIISDSAVSLNGGTIQSGIRFESGAFTNASNIQINVSNGGGQQHGIFINNSGGLALPSGLVILGINIRVSTGGSAQYGVYITSGSLSVADGSITVSGGTSNNFAVYNSTSSKFKMRNLDVSALGGSGNFGLYGASNAGFMKIYSSVLSGTTASIVFGGNVNTRIANSVVNNGVLNIPAGVNCGGVYNANLSLVNC